MALNLPEIQSSHLIDVQMLKKWMYVSGMRYGYVLLNIALCVSQSSRVQYRSNGGHCTSYFDPKSIETETMADIVTNLPFD